MNTVFHRIKDHFDWGWPQFAVVTVAVVVVVVIVVIAMCLNLQAWRVLLK